MLRTPPCFRNASAPLTSTQSPDSLAAHQTTPHFTAAVGYFWPACTTRATKQREGNYFFIFLFFFGWPRVPLLSLSHNATIQLTRMKTHLSLPFILLWLWSHSPALKAFWHFECNQCASPVSSHSPRVQKKCIFCLRQGAKSHFCPALLSASSAIYFY